MHRKIKPIRYYAHSKAVLTLFSFTCFSFKSFHSPLSHRLQNNSSLSFVIKEKHNSDLDSHVFHSPNIFHLNYLEMEKIFKIYIYPDGDPNTFFQTPRKLTGKYAGEGYFFQNIRESRFFSHDPDQAHLFFIPISCHKMRGKGTSYENMTIIVKDYVDMLINKYPCWNRTLGADHFFVTCHDVGVRVTEGFRVVCSPSYDVAFIPHKDVALPQVLQPFAIPGGGNDVENRIYFLQPHQI